MPALGKQIFSIVLVVSSFVFVLHFAAVQFLSDMRWQAASIASLVICALIFIYGYQETGRPVKATFCLIIGLGYTMAFATLAVGHLNILTITFVPILIGLAIDYGVHLISRYEEELRRGRTEQAALIKAIVYLTSDHQTSLNLIIIIIE